MIYFVKLICIVFIFATKIFATNSMPFNSTAKDYINQYKDAALYTAFRDGNHQIIAELLEQFELEKYIYPIAMGLQLEENQDLLALFNACDKKIINISEFIQVLKAFKSQPRKIDEYGDCEPVMLVSGGNNGLNFAELPQYLAQKVANILEY